MASISFVLVKSGSNGRGTQIFTARVLKKRTSITIQYMIFKLWFRLDEEGFKGTTEWQRKRGKVPVGVQRWINEHKKDQLCHGNDKSEGSFSGDNPEKKGKIDVLSRIMYRSKPCIL